MPRLQQMELTGTEPLQKERMLQLRNPQKVEKGLKEERKEVMEVRAREKSTKSRKS
jgi:hypothetical protein